MWLERGADRVLLDYGETTLSVRRGTSLSLGPAERRRFRGFWIVRETIASLEKQGFASIAEGNGARISQCRPGWRAPWDEAAPLAPGAIPLSSSQLDALHPSLRVRLVGLGARPWAVEASIKPGTIWTPPEPFLLLEGNLTTSGNVVVRTPGVDHGVLVVSGSIRCRNLLVGAGFSLFCLGDLTASEVLITTCADSTTDVGGIVRARLLVSGHGAWLTLSESGNVKVRALDGYVMAGGKPLRPKRKPSLDQLVRRTVLDDEEWRSLSAAERREVGLRREDVLRIDERVAMKTLLRGGTILR